MKKIITLSFLISLFCGSLNAQQDTSWSTGGIVAVNFNQTSLSNWAAGGENSLAATGLISLFGKYKKGRASWDNSLDLAYGLLKPGEKKIRKNEDKIDFLSKYGYDLKDKSKFAYAALFNFKSQFDNGFNYLTDTSKNLVSKFGAPAYILLALGIDYKPNKDFSAFLSPLTSKITLVNDQDLADAGSFGVDPAEYSFTSDSTPPKKIKDGKKTRNEFGAYLNVRYQKDILTNVNLLTKLDLFSNYAKNPQNIVVNCEVLVAMKVNKFLTASINTLLIYDDNVDIQQYESKNGFLIPKVKNGIPLSGPRVQFKEVIGIGFAYKF